MNGRQPVAVRLLWALLLLTAAATAQAAPPTIALIIDDMGNRLAAGRRAVALPGKLTYAFLPHSPHAAALAEAAHRRGKEVMLHLPMQPVKPRPLGPGAITLDMTEAALRRTLRDDLATVPHVAGVNNHMGSLITRHPGHMAWLMSELRRRGDLYFVDSRTTRYSVALRLAEEYGVPAVRRHVFLDHKREPAAIRRQYRRLLAMARREGFAVAIGHPYPETLEVLEAVLPRLKDNGVRLVPVSRIVERYGRGQPVPVGAAYGRDLRESRL